MWVPSCLFQHWGGGIVDAEFGACTFDVTDDHPARYTAKPVKGIAVTSQLGRRSIPDELGTSVPGSAV